MTVARRILFYACLLRRIHVLCTLPLPSNRVHPTHTHLVLFWLETAALLHRVKYVRSRTGTYLPALPRVYANKYADKQGVE